MGHRVRIAREYITVSAEQVVGQAVFQFIDFASRTSLRFNSVRLRFANKHQPGPMPRLSYPFNYTGEKVSWKADSNYYYNLIQIINMI